MTQNAICQSENEFDICDDLDVVIEGKIGVTDENCLETITFIVNGQEVEIEGEAAEKIYSALKYRTEHQLNKKFKKLKAEADEYAAEEDFIRREEMKAIDNYEIRKGA